MAVLNSAIWQPYPSIFLTADSSKSCREEEGGGRGRRKGGRDGRRERELIEMMGRDEREGGEGEERERKWGRGGRQERGRWVGEMVVLYSAIWQPYPSIFLPADSSKSCKEKTGREGEREEGRTSLK